LYRPAALEELPAMSEKKMREPAKRFVNKWLRRRRRRRRGGGRAEVVSKPYRGYSLL
jgi:hypothetical protein